MIERDDVMPLMLHAVPSFEPIWRAGEELNVDDDGQRLGYVDASAVAWHLVGLLEKRQVGEVRSAMTVIERLIIEGDDYVKRLGAIGYLEDLQNAAMRSTVVGQGDLVPLLGPESLRWWRGLNAFWSGQLQGRVEPLDDPAFDCR